MEGDFTIRQKSSLITEEDLNKSISKQLKDDGYEEADFTKTQVEVRMVDLSWMLADRKNFVTFMEELSQATNDEIYTTDLIRTFLAEFWEE